MQVAQVIISTCQERTSRLLFAGLSIFFVEFPSITYLRCYEIIILGTVCLHGIYDVIIEIYLFQVVNFVGI